MKKVKVKLVFALNTLFYWFVLYKVMGYLFEDIVSYIFPNSIVAFNMIFIVSIFVFLLPMAMILTHVVFKYIKENY